MNHWQTFYPRVVFLFHLRVVLGTPDHNVVLAQTQTIFLQTAPGCEIRCLPLPFIKLAFLLADL